MNHCQFCDKEMRFSGSVEHVQGYITCGAGKCVKAARRAANHFVNHELERKQREKEAETTIKESIIVFRTDTPWIQDSWKAIPHEEHPDSLQDPHVMERMLRTKEAVKDDLYPDWWYMAMRTDEVRAAMESHEQSEVRH